MITITPIDPNNSLRLSGHFFFSMGRSIPSDFPLDYPSPCQVTDITNYQDNTLILLRLIKAKNVQWRSKHLSNNEQKRALRMNRKEDVKVCIVKEI